MKHIHYLSYTALLAGFCSLCPNTSRAQKNSDSSRQKEPTVLMPVAVQGIRVNNKAPFAVANLDSQAIEKANGVQDIPYLLNQTPSVNITSDAGAGVGYTGIRIRGTDASRINFTMNGIPINDAESQAAIFVDFPDLLGSTNSIQIQRGVGASTNGSGAFGASVNMSNIELPTEAYATFDGAVGSYHTLKGALKAGTGLLKNGFQFDVRLSKINSDGYIDRAFSNLKSFQFLAGWTSNNKNTSLKFNILLGKEKTGQAWNGVPEDSLKTDRTYNGLGLMQNGQYYPDQTDNYEQDYYQLFLNHKFNPFWKAHLALFMTRGKGFYNEYALQESFSDYYQPPFITPKGDTFLSTNLTRQLWLDNYFYGGTYNLNYKKKKTEINIGGSITRYNGKHYGYITWAQYGFPVDYSWYHLTAFKNDFAIYGKWQQKLSEKLYFFADLQYRHVDYEMNGFRHHPNLKPTVHYDFLNPKLGFSYITYHNNGALSKIYISLALAHKEPNRSDFEANPNDLPQPEVLYDGEIGYQYKANSWQIALNGYYMYYYNQLIPTGKINDVGAYTRVNVPKSFRRGIEAMADYNPFKQLSLKANATLSENKIDNFHEFIDDNDNGNQTEKAYTSTDIAFSPNFIAYFQASVEPFAGKWEKQHFYINITEKHISRQYLDNSTSKVRSINPYSITNLCFRYNLEQVYLKGISISLSINNIFNEKYSANGYTYSYIENGKRDFENYYFPQAGTNFILGLQLNF